MHRKGRRAIHRKDAWASVSPKGQVLASLAVLLPVALSGLALVAFAPPFWWVFTTYFWVAFPALDLLRRGVAGLLGEGAPSLDNRKERELLGALLRHEELSPARAAMETSLTVAEADRMLRGLAEGGHVEVRARGGALFYALWEAPESAGAHDVTYESIGGSKLKLLASDGAGERLERSGT